MSRRVEEKAATSFTFSTEGKVNATSLLASKVSIIQHSNSAFFCFLFKVGTTVSAAALFANLPVRRNYYKVLFNKPDHDAFFFTSSSPRMHPERKRN